MRKKRIEENKYIKQKSILILGVYEIFDFDLALIDIVDTNFQYTFMNYLLTI
jgi:hypothetical protein